MKNAPPCGPGPELSPASNRAMLAGLSAGHMPRGLSCEFSSLNARALHHVSAHAQTPIDFRARGGASVLQDGNEGGDRRLLSGTYAPPSREAEQPTR